MTDADAGAGSIRSRFSSGRTPAGGGLADSLIQTVQRLKEQILDKERVISDKTSQLLATRDYLRGVFAALADAVLVIDVEGRVEFANQAAHEMLDAAPDGLLGLEARTLWADPGQGALFAGAALAELLERGTFQRSDGVLLSRRGNEVPVSFSSSVLRIDDRPPALVGIARDVRVERRHEEEKLRTVQALAASVAHEIRNPLGAIQSSVALLRRDLKVEGDDRTLLDIVFEETDRISRIVSQFLDFARPRPPQLQPQVELGPLLQDVVRLAAQDERALAGKELFVHVEPGLPPATLDPDQVRQVVWNLVSNALDAARGRIAVRARLWPGAVEVRVADDGPGMSPEVLARAFEPFRTTKAKGTGLGLSISKRIIEGHGGSIRLESAPGAGAAVAFTIPLAAPTVTR